MPLRPSISQDYYVTKFTFCRHVGSGLTAFHRWWGWLMLARAKLNQKAEWAWLYQRTSAGLLGLLHLTLKKAAAMLMCQRCNTTVITNYYLALCRKPVCTVVFTLSQSGSSLRARAFIDDYRRFNWCISCNLRSTLLYCKAGYRRDMFTIIHYICEAIFWAKVFFTLLPTL